MQVVLYGREEFVGEFAAMFSIILKTMLTNATST